MHFQSSRDETVRIHAVFFMSVIELQVTLLRIDSKQFDDKCWWGDQMGHYHLPRQPFLVSCRVE